jgi:hypothetical protein
VIGHGHINSSLHLFLTSLLLSSALDPCIKSRKHVQVTITPCSGERIHQRCTIRSADQILIKGLTRHNWIGDFRFAGVSVSFVYVHFAFPRFLELVWLFWLREVQFHLLCTSLHSSHTRILSALYYSIYIQSDRLDRVSALTKLQPRTFFDTFTTAPGHHLE